MLPFPLGHVACRHALLKRAASAQNNIPLELASLRRERTFLAYIKRPVILANLQKADLSFSFLSLSPLSVRVKCSEVLSDDVTAIVEIKECEGTGFSSSKHRFSKPASIYGRKENGGLVILTRVVFST